MEDIFGQQKVELTTIIQTADTLEKYLQGCISAYKIICNVEPQHQGELFGWFLEQAECEWLFRPYQKKQLIQQKRIMQLLDNVEALPDSADDVLKHIVGVAEGYEESTSSEETTSYHIANSLSSCKAKFGKLISGIIDLHSSEGGTKEKYYSKLWNTLNFVLRTYSEIEQGICLFLVLRDKRTPYWEITPGLQMSEDEYQSAVVQLSPKLRKMLYVLSLSVGQRTETASQLLQIMEELNSYEEKVVFLSQVIAQVESDD